MAVVDDVQTLRKRRDADESIFIETTYLTHTPPGRFGDAVRKGAAHIEDLVAQTRARDEELARAAANAKHAGEPDPYKKPADRPLSDEVSPHLDLDVDVEAR